jgi:hypothetical protein
MTINSTKGEVNMIDINTILATAVQQAVQQAVQETIAPIAQRMTALESAIANNPATGEDTTLARDVRTALMSLFKEDIEAFNFVRHAMEEIVENAINEHLDAYDHESYDHVVSQSDDFVQADNLYDEIRDALSNAALRIQMSR